MQLAAKWFFNFCPSWAEVGFWSSDQLGWRLFFSSRQVVGKLILKILSNLGRIIFLKFFLEMLLKMPFSSATTGRDFFCGHSPKRKSRRLPLEETFWKIADDARIKSLVSPATIWKQLWTKSVSHRLHLKVNSSVQGANVKVFSGGIWRKFSKTRW